jgi:lipopolysaccharide transport system ATP-binding protein
MAAFAVRAEGLGKRYRMGRIETGYMRLARAVGRGRQQWMWALRDVSFELAQGDSIAIIGRNGAGKSTLLKILSRITEPTTGHADICGRVGSLLEVGTGFHGELTGRENIFLNGALLGMRRPEVARKFDQIVEFSGIAEHLDTPVKWYSSGMYVRLAFAVAAHLEPEILIVDEVLAVGDAEFQRRCLGRMGEVVNEGRTVMFVSHNMQAVRRLCRSAIMLERGQLVDQGDTTSVTERYLASIDSEVAGRRRWPEPETRPGNEICRVVEVRVTNERGDVAGSFFSSRPINVAIEFDLDVVDSAFTVAFDLMTSDGVLLFCSHHRDVANAPVFHRGRNCVQATIPPGLLNAGRYIVNLRISLQMIGWVAYEDSVLHFDVIADHGESEFVTARQRSGVIAPVLDWVAIEPEPEDEPAQPPAPAFLPG